MGQPKKQRRKYSTPKHMFKGREGESELIRTYGLKNARELWREKSEVARIRALARGMLATPDEKTEKDLLGRLTRAGLVGKDAKLEDILNITIDNILDRRLQTQVYKRGLCNSIKQARQEIVHGHIAIAGQRINAPGHLTTLEEAEKIAFYPGSALANPEHPIRKVEKKASSDKRVEEEERPRFKGQRKNDRRRGGYRGGQRQGGYRGGPRQGGGQRPASAPAAQKAPEKKGND